jgi:hypothetical protein
MKLKVKRKYRTGKFKKHFKKTYKKKNRTHRVKKHRKNKTKNNRRKSKKYFGGAGGDAENLVTQHLMEKIKKISTVNWRGKKSDEKTNCKKLNDLVDEMHKLESSSSIKNMYDMDGTRVKVYNMPVKNSLKKKKKAKVGQITSVTPDNKAHIKWDDGDVTEDIELRITRLDSKGFTNGKEFMFVGHDDKYKPFKKSN